PWPVGVQPFCRLAAAAAPEPARATLPAVTATSASAIASAPAIFRRLLILSSSSMTGKTYALCLENGSRREVEKVTGRRTVLAARAERSPFARTSARASAPPSRGLWPRLEQGLRGAPTRRPAAPRS